jgi:hypothetical protein
MTHGHPTTWVYAESEDPEAILDGIAAGRVSISYTTEAARLDLTADQNGDGSYKTMMGDTILTDGNPVIFNVQIIGGESGPGDVVRVPRFIIRHLNKGRLTFWDMLWFLITLGRMESRNLQFLSVIKNGDLFKAWLISGGANKTTFADTPDPDSQSFFRAELYGEPDVESLSRLVYGFRIALTNPIYVNYE